MTSFCKADGLAFELQNLRQVATGKGLGNVLHADREVWEEFGRSPARTKEYARLVRAGIEIMDEVRRDPPEDEVFAERRVVTETHLRRERDARLRNRLLEERRIKFQLECEICSRATALKILL